jgi:uncharacterized protein (DUF342 family)
VFTKTSEPTALDEEIARLLSEMAETEMESEEYSKLTDHFIKLYKLKAETAPKRVSADTWALIAANLAGIILVIGYERANVITTKALAFIQKLR